MQLDTAIDSFLGQWPLEGPKRPSPDTVRTYAWQLNAYRQFAAARGLLTVDETLQPGVLRAALQAQMDETRRHSAVHKGGEAAAASMAAATRRLARWLLAQGVPVADLSVVKAPRAPERIQPRLLPEEFEALERATLRMLIDGDHVMPQLQVARDLALLYLLYDTGLRCHEAANLSLDDVDFERGCVWIRRGGKGGKQRALSVVDANDPHGGKTLRFLAEWIRAREHTKHAAEHNFLWVSIPFGQPLNRANLRLVLKALCKAAGLDGNRPPHSFRRANFTEHYNADPHAMELLRRRMGWSEGSHMISIYTRGAEVEIAATQPLPSLAGRRAAGKEYERTVPIRGRVPFRYMDGGGAGSTARFTDAAVDQPSRGRRPIAR